MFWNEIVIETTPEKIEEASIFFYNNNIFSLNIEDPRDIMSPDEKLRWDYIDENLQKKDKTKAFVKVYVEDNEDADFLVNEGKNKGFNIYINRLKAEDWENGWKKYYKTFKITDDITVVPAWEDYEKKENEKVITLDSGMAFGTGTHETTKMCAEHIEKYVNCKSKVLDVGTGSGILAIIASLCGSSDVTGIDIDELSVKVAKENILLNDKENVIKVFKGDLLKGIDGKYDVIIANIVADVIKMLIPVIKDYLNDNGTFIVSGIINDRLNEVIDFAKENGLKIENQVTLGEWSSIVLK